MPLQQEQWARVRADTECKLRRGAWYRVIRLSPLEAVVDVNHVPMNVPRSSLQIRPGRPSVWSVVPRPRNSARLPMSWGAKYVVCPNCRERAPLGGRPQASMRCPRCNGVFEIAWGDDPY